MTNRYSLRLAAYAASCIALVCAAVRGFQPDIVTEMFLWIAILAYSLEAYDGR